MARTSTSLGMGIAVTVLGVLTFALFITTLVFFGQKQKAERELSDLETNTRQFIRSDERQRDDVQRFSQLASNDGGKSVVGYLIDSQRQAMTRVTGAPRDTVDQLESKLAGAGVGEGENALGALRSRANEIDGLNQRLSDAVSAAETARQDLTNEQERVQTISDEFAAELAAVKSQLDANQELVDTYREGINDQEARMDARLEQARSDARNTEAQLNDQIRRLERDLLTYRDTIARLQQESAADRPSPTDEFALVDGEVVGLNPGDGEVFIGLGRRDKVRVGMTFSVYAEPTSIRVSDDGEYAQGKGFVEIVRVDENTSAARVLRELPGNPIVVGDVLANPVYDPDKVYKFIVYGNFDADGDGLATPFERRELEAQIGEWGGEVISSAEGITGDVDFLVLGAKPALPPAPPGDAPVDVLREYARLTRVVRTYDDLLDQAKAISLPVLNENRLQTLLYGR